MEGGSNQCDQVTCRAQLYSGTSDVWDPLFSGYAFCPLSEVKSVLELPPFGTLKLVLCSEVISIVPYSACPLSEVPL